MCVSQASESLPQASPLHPLRCAGMACLLQVEWQWRQVPAEPSSSCPARRDMSALLQLQDGQLLLFGGRSESQRALQDTWLYDITRCVLMGQVPGWMPEC
jgi:hypothetical protein